MPNHREQKVFTIEKTLRDSAGKGNKGPVPLPFRKKVGQVDKAAKGSGDASYEELLFEIKKLRSDVSRLVGADDIVEVEKAPTTEVIEDYKNQIIEATNLRKDLQELSDAIEATKVEIAALRADTVTDDKIHVASLELSAVVKDTETATDRIIESAEVIETLTERLRAEGQDESTTETLEEIAERVISIFEACNFQDITGQRITKVVNTMNFIDERIHGMMDIWGGKELFEGLAEAPVADEDEMLLNGPALPGSNISQDEIDALFD